MTTVLMNEPLSLFHSVPATFLGPQLSLQKLGLITLQEVLAVKTQAMMNEHKQHFLRPASEMAGLCSFKGLRKHQKNKTL